MSIKGVVAGAVAEVKMHWSKPAKGKYISYKEATAYSVGGMGVQFVIYTMAMIGLSASSFIFGSAYGIRPLDLQLLGVISTLLNIVLNPIKSMLIDNTRFKAGKFRPYLLTMGIPSLILAVTFVFIPTDLEYFAKMAILFVLFVGMQFFLSLYTTAYGTLVQVMSPDSRERTAVISISSIVYSIAPTITNAVFPLIASAFPGNMTNIDTYRLIFPVFMTIGVLFGWISYFGTKERIVVSKQYKPRVKFLDGMEKVAKNKFFWITNVSGILGAVKGSFGQIFPWLMVYGLKGTLFGMDSMALYSVLSVMMGTSALPGMALTPLFINKFGKKKVIVVSHAVYLVGIIGLSLTFTGVASMPTELLVLLFFVFNYITQFANATSIVTGPAVGADVLDYQQYKTGDRLEGFIGQTGATLTGLVGLGSGLIVPFMYEFYGLKEDYNILYVDDVRNSIFVMLLAVSLIGTVLAVLPYILYDLSESKHRNIMRILIVRAMFEDYHNGQITDEQLVKAIDKIREAEERVAMEIPKTSKADLITAKAMQINTPDEKKTRRVEIKRIKKELSEIKMWPQRIKNAQKVLDEVHKFDLPEIIAQVEDAERIVAAGLVPNGKNDVKVAKHYPNGVVRPDEKKYKELTDGEINRGVVKEILALNQQIVIFNRVFKEYVGAEKLLAQRERYIKYDEILAKYDDSLARVREKERIENERIAQEKADKIAEMEEYKAEKLAMKEARKNR